MPAWIPTWLLQMIVNAAIKLGVPWVMKQFPWIASIIPNFAQIIQDLADQLTGHHEVKKAMIQNAVAKLRA